MTMCGEQPISFWCRMALSCALAFACFWSVDSRVEAAADQVVSCQKLPNGKCPTFQGCRKLLQSWKSLLKLDRKGERLYKRKAYKEALVQYEKVHQQLQRRAKSAKDPKARSCASLYARSYVSRLAITYHWQKLFLQAHRLYQRCAVESPKKRQRKACQKQIARVRLHLVKLDITVLPVGADLLLRRGKGAYIPVGSPLRRWFLPGTFLLQMSKKGHAIEQEQLVLAPGTSIKRTFHLRRAPCPSIKNIGGGAGGILFINPSTPTPVSTSVSPLKTSRQELHSDPLELHPGLTPTQIALVVGGVTAGAALLGLGVYGIYRLNTRIYNWSPGTP